jgi:hypothetical protein
MHTVFSGNRHGNAAGDGVAGSVSRFRYDYLAKTFTKIVSGCSVWPYD